MTGRQAHKEWIGKTPNSRPPKTVRLRLFRKADGCCQICTLAIDSKAWHADHIEPLEDGGENRESNLQVACEPCHQEKTGEENARRDKADRAAMVDAGIKDENRRKIPNRGKAFRKTEKVSALATLGPPAFARQIARNENG